MRQAIRALGWATKIFWIVIAVFMITCLYSAMGLMIGGGIQFGEPEVSFSNGTATVSLPFSFNNTGLYDISDLNITTCIADYNGTVISTSTTFVPLIPHGNNVEEAHNVSISLDNIVSKNLTYLFFNSGNFSMEIFAGLKFAHIFPFQISINTTMPWGAPLNNFSIGEISFDYEDQKVAIPLSFKNDSPFDVSGNLSFDIYNDRSELIGSSSIPKDINVKSGQRHEYLLQASVDVLKLTKKGRILLFLKTSIFSIEKEVEWGIPNG